MLITIGLLKIKSPGPGDLIFSAVDYSQIYLFKLIYLNNKC